MKISSNVVIVAVGFAALLLSGCTESQQAQCSKLTPNVEKLEPLLTELPKNIRTILLENQPKDRKDITAIATSASKIGDLFQKTSGDLNQIAQNVKSINLSDEKLKNYQAKYTENIAVIENGFKLSAQEAKKISKVKTEAELKKAETNIPPEVLQSQQKVPVAINESVKLASEIKTYCNPQSTSSPQLTPSAPPSSSAPVSPTPNSSQ